MMTHAQTPHQPSRKDPVVRRIVARWRRLTGGRAVRDSQRPTLVACSGGADSSALLLALSTVSPAPAVAHILHDMRPAEEAEHDLEVTADLCAHLGITFHEGRVSVAESAGNTEANARHARYGELAAIAKRAGCGFVATGHHADDQLETVLMRLIRGTGVRGLEGIHPSRPLCEGVTLIRPMLDVTSAESAALCRRCGWVWAVDCTNTDLSMRRAAIRERVLPAILDVEPDAARRAVRLAEALRSTREVIELCSIEQEEQAEEDGSVIRFSREKLRSVPSAVLAELIMRQHHSKTGGQRRDRLSQRVLTTCIGVIHADSGGIRVFDVGGLYIEVCSKSVCFS